MKIIRNTESTMLDTIWRCACTSCGSTIDYDKEDRKNRKLILHIQYGQTWANINCPVCSKEVTIPGSHVNMIVWHTDGLTVSSDDDSDRLEMIYK